MLTVVTFKWKAPHWYRSQFTAEHVNRLRAMVARFYPQPHRFVCVTDDRKGLDPSVEPMTLWEDFSELQNPHGRGNPSCYRRLKVFGHQAREWFGERFICMDLDTVIVGDLTPVFSRTEDFVIWGETNPKSFYNGSLFMMTAGARAKVLEQFDPRTSPGKAKKAGRFGSDQGWISYLLGPGEATWGRDDGVYSYRVHIEPKGGNLPANARIVCFHGKEDPWSPKAQQLSWVRDNWGKAA